jgi:hypothetical protein
MEKEFKCEHFNFSQINVRYVNGAGIFFPEFLMWAMRNGLIKSHGNCPVSLRTKNYVGHDSEGGGK